MNKTTFLDLLDQGLRIQNIWISADKTVESPYNLKGLKKIKCKRSNNLCYLPKNINHYQVLAIYINEIYGDGFYYIKFTKDEDELYYLLIIKDGDVSCETDCVINKEMLEHFIIHKDYSEYKDLEIKELDSHNLNVILDEYCTVKAYTLKKNKRLSLSLLTLFLISSFSVIFFIGSIVNI